MKKFLLITSIATYLFMFFGMSFIELSTNVELWGEDNRACLVFMPPVIILSAWGIKNILDS